MRTCTRLQENAALRKEMVAVEEKFNAKALSLKGGIEVLEGKVRLRLHVQLPRVHILLSLSYRLC